jgi:UDP-N-acetylmuramoylalanine--D-glutamate ligase
MRVRNALAALSVFGDQYCGLGPMPRLRDCRGEPHRVSLWRCWTMSSTLTTSKGNQWATAGGAVSTFGVDRKAVVILGGEGKGQDFSPLAAPVIEGHARAVALLA